MKDILAEKLLVRILGWNREQVAEELRTIQALSLYKYDEYQQFSPGMRFIESLARWLGQFPQDRRDAAYRFVRDQMIFCSAAEVRHWVEMAYPDFIRPRLLRRVAGENGFPELHVPRVAATKEFQVHQRQTLFLGLSDGARIDLFRRSNPELNHEQIWQTHELADERVQELLDNLKTSLTSVYGEDPPQGSVRFHTVVLLDDFSASGHSYYMPKPGGALGGKITKFHHKLVDPGGPLHRLVDLRDTEIIVMLYAATEQALEHIRLQSQVLWGDHVKACHVDSVQLIPREVCLCDNSENSIRDLIKDYYDDDAVFDKHLKKGGTPDARYGYAGCGLPLVLHHNTPNNSLALLWSYEDANVRGLFPRITRHKELA